MFFVLKLVNNLWPLVSGFLLQLVFYEIKNSDFKESPGFAKARFTVQYTRHYKLFCIRGVDVCLHSMAAFWQKLYWGSLQSPCPTRKQ